MLEYMVNWVITERFEKAVGKWQSKNQKPLALHVGFSTMSKEDYDVGNQYHSHHVFIYAPQNYVYVVCQERWIDAGGKAHTKPMDILCCHDSCWRDAVERLIFDLRETNIGWQSFGILSQMDVVELTEEQIEYMRSLRLMRDNSRKEYADGQRPPDNPFHLGDDMFEYWRDKIREVKYSIV